VTYGFVSVATHPRECRIARVRVNGIDVTRDCFAADDEQGFADCFERNEHGRHYARDGNVARQRLTGAVVIDFPQGLD
jgi:hypothetical protein